MHIEIFWISASPRHVLWAPTVPAIRSKEALGPLRTEIYVHP